MSAWYKQSFPRVKYVKDYLHKVAKIIKQFNGVKHVYVWGSYLQKKDNPSAILKDLDLIASTTFLFEDLNAIIDNEDSPLTIKESQLEDEGFDPKAVKFTKSFLDLTHTYVDPWVLSCDKKILHWGPVVEDQEEWREIRDEADNYATFEMGLKKKQLKKASQPTKDRWLVLHDHYINKYLKGIPNGWYELQYEYNALKNKIEKVL
jgi:hypothetical protein